MRKLFLSGLFAISFGTIIGCSNPSTPAGYVGYVRQSAFVGKEHFYTLQTGPTSTGLGWLLNVTNVTITPITFDEEFKDSSAILAKDNLTISFALHTVLKVKPDKVKTLVEEYTTDAINPVTSAYNQYLKEPLRTYARDELQKHDSFGIKDNITQISQQIDEKARGLTANTPFEIIQVVVGNIQYPPEVANAVSKKMAAAQLLEQQDTQLKIKEKEAQQRVAEANGIAQATHIINRELTPEYLQHEAIEAQKVMVNSPNHTTIYLPVGPMGVPLVGTFNTSTKSSSGQEK